jgi:hypothetical protein
MAGAFQLSAFQDTPAFQTGAAVPFVGKSIVWGFYRAKRDHEAKLLAERQPQQAVEAEPEAWPEAPEVPSRSLAVQRIEAFAWLAEQQRRDREYQAAVLAQMQAQAIRAAEFQRQQERAMQAIALQEALDAEAAQAFLTLLMNDIL